MILIDAAQSNNNLTIDIMSESYPHLEGGVIKDFKDILIDRKYWRDARWNSTKHIYTFESGSTIKFISIDQIGKAHGPRRDILFVNEANNISWDIFVQLMQRTSGDVWIDWNPSVEFWYYTEIKGKIDHDFITLTYLDNEGLQDSIIEFIESRKGNKNWWTVYGLGQLGEVEGKIYTGWEIIKDIPHEARLARRGIDFGYTVDPTVIEDIYEYNGGFIIDENTYQKGLSNKTIADKLNAQDPRVLTIADSSEPKSIQEIKDYGINIIGANKGPGSVSQGIQWVQAQKISVTERSVKTIKAYRNYLNRKDKKTGLYINEPDDTVHEWSNPMDAIRYGLNSFKPNKPEVKDAFFEEVGTYYID